MNPARIVADATLFLNANMELSSEACGTLILLFAMVEDTFETAPNAFLGTSTWPTPLPLGRLTTEVRKKETR